MESILGIKFIALVTVVFAAVAMAETEAQNLPCIMELAACTEFYQNTSLTPTPECCGPLAVVLTSEVPCICAIFTNRMLHQRFGIDVQMGMGLFYRCNITGLDPNLCTAAAPGPASQAEKSPVTSAPPNKAPSGAEWIGFATFFSLLLFIMA